MFDLMHGCYKATRSQAVGSLTILSRYCPSLVVKRHRIIWRKDVNLPSRSWSSTVFFRIGLPLRCLLL